MPESIVRSTEGRRRVAIALARTSSSFVVRKKSRRMKLIRVYPFSVHCTHIRVLGADNNNYEYVSDDFPFCDSRTHHSVFSRFSARTRHLVTGCCVQPIRSSHFASQFPIASRFYNSVVSIFEFRLVHYRCSHLSNWHVYLPRSDPSQPFQSFVNPR